MTNMSIVEIENQVLRNRLADMKKTTKKLIDAVEQYVEPKPGGKYMHRTTLLEIKNELKKQL